MSYDDLRDLPLLTEDEEAYIFDGIAAGDLGLIDNIVKHNFRLAADRANRFRGRGVDIEDLVQEALLGIQIAAGKFKREAGTRFSTYATLWADHYVRRAVQKSGDVRLPIYAQDVEETPTLSFVIASTDGEEGTYDPPSNFPSPLEEAERKQWARKVRAALKHLNDREANIIIRYYGLSGDPTSITVLAEEQGVTKPMIVKIRKRAERRIAKYL